MQGSKELGAGGQWETEGFVLLQWISHGRQVDWEVADPQWVCGGKLSHTHRFFSPPENSAFLETPENESSKLHCGKIRASLHWGRLCGSRLKKLEVQNTPSNGPCFWDSRLHLCSTFGLNWVECFLGLGRRTRFREEIGLCYINATFFTFMFWIHAMCILLGSEIMFSTKKIAQFQSYFSIVNPS